MTSPSNLLTDDHKRQIKDALVQTNEALREANLAKQAGIDLGAAYQQLIDNKAKLEALRDTYFPGQ